MNNELIAAIDAAAKTGNAVKSIRKQKYDPANFYMTLMDGGKQVGPIKCEGNQDELNRKFSEAQAHLQGQKPEARSKAA